MAGRLKNFTVHGAFKSKTDAVREEKKVHGFILRRKIRGHLRYVVMIIPAAAQIEAAAAELPSVPTDALVTQRHELSEFGAERLQELGASGLSQDAMIGYALGLQTARVMIKENVEIQMKGLNPAAIL